MCRSVYESGTCLSASEGQSYIGMAAPGSSGAFIQAEASSLGLEPCAQQRLREGKGVPPSQEKVVQSFLKRCHQGAIVSSSQTLGLSVPFSLGTQEGIWSHLLLSFSCNTTPHPMSAGLLTASLPPIFALPFAQFL